MVALQPIFHFVAYIAVPCDAMCAQCYPDQMNRAAAMHRAVSLQWRFTYYRPPSLLAEYYPVSQ